MAFDAAMCDDVAAVCNQLDLRPTIVFAEPGASAEHFPASVAEAMQRTDITLYFSRLGDQLRFLDSPGNSRKVMCYTLDRAHLASPFAGIDYRTMQRVHDGLLQRMRRASRYRIEAANGTALQATLPNGGDADEPLLAEFSLALFPVMIFPPIHFYRLSGRLVLEHFLLSSSTRAYDDSVLMLDSPVTLDIEDSRIVDIAGDPALVERLRRQLERAAAITGGDAYRLNSWHTGINPWTFFDGDPYRDLERWGTVAYGSPRYTHIHAAGNDPGDIAMQLFDASIHFDDDALWENGRFSYLDSDEVRMMLTAAEHEQLNASLPLDIGIA